MQKPSSLKPVTQERIIYKSQLDFMGHGHSDRVRLIGTEPKILKLVERDNKITIWTEVTIASAVSGNCCDLIVHQRWTGQPFSSTKNVFGGPKYYDTIFFGSLVYHIYIEEG